MLISEVLDIAETLPCPFDYHSVAAACKAAAVPVPSSHNFAAVMGHALIGKSMFPESSSLHDAWQRHTANVVISEEDSPGFIPPSRGLGDTVAKFTHALGLNKLAEAYTAITGKPCGCGERQQRLNELLPYEAT